MTGHRMEFLVIGAQKCATSWLCSCFKEHPEIHLPAKKKEMEYLGGDLFEEKGADWYFDFVKNAEPHQNTGDVSVEYISDPRAPQIARQYISEVNIVAFLRDAIDRAISACYRYTRKNKIPVLPLKEELCWARDDSLTLPGPQGEKNQDILARVFNDEHLVRYRAFVPAGRIHDFLYDHVSADPKQMLKETFQFLGVAECFVPSAIDEQPKKSTYFKPPNALERLAPRVTAVGKAIDLTNRFLRKMNGGTGWPRLTGSLAQSMLTLYKPCIRCSEAMVNESRGSAQLEPIDLTRMWISKWRS